MKKENNKNPTDDDMKRFNKQNTVTQRLKKTAEYE